jgi:DNA modification methylase
MKSTKMNSIEVMAQLVFDYRSEEIGLSRIVYADCFEWLSRIPENSIHAIVTDPPYGVKEYEFDQIEKRSNGNGGIWRIPPSFDGSIRAPLPRFTALDRKERDSLRRFFGECARVVVHALRPQSFLHQVVHAALPLGEGIIVDPFMGSGSAVAAAEALGLHSIGVERYLNYYEMSHATIPKLAAIKTRLDKQWLQLPLLSLV